MTETHPWGHTIWGEVDTGALKHNFGEVRRLAGSSVRIMAVVKADAYGHGTAGAARAFTEAGADYLGVTSLEEGLIIRDGGISTPVLVFSPLLPDQMDAAISAGLEQTVCDLSLAESISKTAVRLNTRARIHLKVDTGMGRLGIQHDDSPDVMYRLLNLPGIEVAGIYTHFANAGSKDLTDARKQNTVLRDILAVLAEKDMPVGIRHAANSAALIGIPESHYDMVRPGTILYGQYPTTHVEKKLDLKETWQLKTRIVALRRLLPGQKVGYGSEFTVSSPTVAAVIPIGYSDGFTLIPESVARRAFQPLRMAASRILGGKPGPSVSIRGNKCPVIGRISMQMCSVDVTHVSGVSIGDEVIVPARRTTTSSRVARVYV